MTVLSIDLAYKRFVDFGVAISSRDGSTTRVKLDRRRPAGTPTPANTSDWIGELATAHNATHVLLDGPQGWKSESSSLVHSRACEQTLNTPAKTGTKGIAKPRNYTAFVQFSIDVFEILTHSGMSLLGRPHITSSPVLVESFPLGAWRKLELKHLPAKARSTDANVSVSLDDLKQVFSIELEESPTHDELQALVSGMGGVQLAYDGVNAVSLSGTPPARENDYWCEGYIVCPLRPVVSGII